MSGDNHNQADPLDLDAIEARAEKAMRTGDVGLIYFTTTDDVPALVAEVRRLRAQVERVEWLHQSNEASVAKCIEDGQLWPCVTLGEMARTE